jgi:hypothetical protein
MDDDTRQQVEAVLREYLTKRLLEAHSGPDFEVEVLPDDEVLITCKVSARVLIRPKCKTE